MNYGKYTVKTSNMQDWEMKLAAQEESVLEHVRSFFDRMLRADGMINVDEMDLITMFYNKGEVMSGYVKVSEGALLSEDTAKLLEGLQKSAGKKLSNVLFVVAGDVEFLEATEAAVLIEEQLGEDVNIVFGIFEDSMEAGTVEIMMAGV